MPQGFGRSGEDSAEAAHSSLAGSSLNNASSILVHSSSFLPTESSSTRRLQVDEHSSSLSSVPSVPPPTSNNTRNNDGTPSLSTTAFPSTPDKSPASASSSLMHNTTPTGAAAITLQGHRLYASWSNLYSRPRFKQAAVMVLVVLALLLRSDVRLPAEHPHSHKNAHPWDVNGPPVTLNDSDTIQSLIEQEQRLERRSTTTTTPQSGMASGTTPSYPVLKDNDQSSALPMVSSTTTVHAAEALLCRKSVVNFVINATDIKDECEGLKKAFDKTCSNNDESSEGSGGGGAGGSQRRNRRRRQRVVEVKTLHAAHIKLFVHRQYRWIRHWTKQIFGASEFFFSEEAVVQAYDDAQCLVDDNVDYWAYSDLRKRWSVQQDVERRRLQDALAEADSDGSSATTTNNKTLPIRPPPVSLDLPTSSEHISDKVLSEALLLQQGNKMIEKAHNESAKKNVEALKDAKASSKAVAETNAAVAALLNDPSSIEARTCCASILSVYHENCSTDDEEQFSDSRLFLVVFVLAVCGMVKSLIRHFKLLWLPEAAGCILVGVLSGYILMFFPHHDISFDGNWFLRIMVPPIVFEAALSIDKRSFTRHVVPIAIYAVVGTLMSTVLTAWVLHGGTTLLSRFCTPIPTVEALTFGALISSIDPIAVLSVLSNMGMTDTDTIYVLIFGESLLNDGVSIVLFQTLVHFLDDNLVIDSSAICAAMVHFLVVAIGSLLIGVASGVISTVYYWLFHGCQTPLVEVLMFLCWAMLPYYVCDGIEWSGIVAAVANGFVMDLYIVGQLGEDQPLPDDSEEYFINYRATTPESTSSSKDRVRRRIFSPHGHLSTEARQHIGFVTECLATALETAIFAYLGIFLFSHRYHWNFFHTVIAIVACCASRAVMIPSLSLVANWITRLQHSRTACRAQLNTKKSTPSSFLATSGPPGVVIDKRMQVVLWFAGLRGAMSFALVEYIPLYDSVSGEGTILKPELKAMTSASIMFTVFVLGGYTYYMMDYLGLAPQGSRRSNGSSQGAYEMAALISKVDSGDGDDNNNNNVFEPKRSTEPPTNGRSKHTAFRRQRHAIPDASSPSNDEGSQPFKV